MSIPGSILLTIMLIGIVTVGFILVVLARQVREMQREIRAAWERLEADAEENPLRGTIWERTR